jgi:hypothetical protein
MQPQRSTYPGAQLNNIGRNVRILADVLNPKTLNRQKQLTFGMSPIPAMFYWLGLNLCVQQGVGQQRQQQTMQFFVRYILSNFLRKLPGRMMHRMIPNLSPFMKQVFSQLRRPEFILPPLRRLESILPPIKRQRQMPKLPSSQLSIVAPLHLRNLRENVINGMALVGALNPKTLLPFKPFALHMSPILAMMNFLGLKLFVQQACVGHCNQTNNVSLFRRYMVSKFMRNPGKMIQMMIPNYRMFMTHVFLETKRTNPFCKQGIPYPIVPFFFGAIEPRHFRNFREMIRSCVSQMSYLHLELFTRQNYRVLIELYCKDGVIQYFSITVQDQFGNLVKAGDIAELKASQQTRDLFVPKLTPFAICLSSSEFRNSFLRRRSFVEFGYTSNISLNIGYDDFNLNVVAIQLSTKKP